MGNNCYSSGEQKFMVASQVIRTQVFMPLIKTLHAFGVTANHVTIASLICGIFSAVLMKDVTFPAFFLLFLHVFLDGLDGPLARFTSTDTNKGSFTDTVVDLIVFFLIMLSLIYAGWLSLWNGGVFTGLYLAVVIFSIDRNRLGIPYANVIRPRFAVYLGLAVEYFVYSGSLECFVFILNFLMLFYAWQGFWAIRQKM